MKTNRPHYSWSQHDLWHRSKREFWKRYNQGIEPLSNKYFRKGDEFAKFMENGQELPSSDGMLTLMKETIPTLEVTEKELYATLNISGNDKKVKLLAYLDKCNLDFSEFIEYKTGKIEWNQERVNEHGQLTFYATVIYLITGEIPKSKLVWVETMETDNGLQFTGRIETFERSFDEKEIKAFTLDIINTVNEIEEYEYDELEIDDELSRRYVHLQNVVEQAQQEMAEIKLSIQSMLLENDVKFGKSSLGNFFIQQRKSWNYSSVVDDIKSELSKQQKKEQKDGIATFSVSESLIFKLNKP